jgi:hypothetical protein
MPKSRFLSLPGNYLLIGAVVLFMAALVASACPGGRGRLAAPDMSRSRGGSFDQDWYYCADYAGYAVCTVQMALHHTKCNECGPSNAPSLYEDIGGSGFAIDPPSGGAVYCGEIYNGTCSIIGIQPPFCDTTGGMTRNDCPKPSGPPPYEP